MVYIIEKNGKVLIDGRTDHYNFYNVYHDVTDDELDIELIQKIKNSMKLI